MQLMDMEKLDLSKLEGKLLLACRKFGIIFIRICLGLSPETLQMLLRKVNMEKQYKRNKKSGDKQGSNAMEVDQVILITTGR
jgi:hypothetical protein